VGTYYDDNGKPTHEGRQMVQSLEETGAVWDRLDRTSDPVVKDLMRKTHAACFQYFERKGIDPFTQKYPVSFVLEGTMRAGGGIAIDDDLSTGVPGLFAAGDVTSREKLTGAGPPGGGPASAWAFASGYFAGQSAAVFANTVSRGLHGRTLTGLGSVALRPAPRAALGADEVIEVVKGEMHPHDKNYWRTGAAMHASLSRLNTLWTEVADHLGFAEQATSKATARARLKAREAASLLAAARWIYAAAEHRTESRGLHRRKDHPSLDPEFDGIHVLTGGLDQVWTRRERHRATLTEKLGAVA
jgi:succinate dehydrogenase/fumarate reductase flavoprotein subunit